MDDLINRQAIHDTVIARYPDSDATQYSVGYADAINDVLKDIRYMPSAESETARIIIGRSMSGMTMWYQCDMCNEPVDEHDAFCSGCGRRFVHE